MLEKCILINLCIPYDSAPKLVDSMNNALVRADQIQHMELKDGDMKEENKVDYMLPNHC